MEETISLKEIFQTLKQRWKLLVVIPMVAMAVAAVVSFFVLTPMYERSTQILVNQSGSEGTFTQQDLRTNVEIINTYSDIINSPAILNEVIEEANLDLNYSELVDMVSVGNENESQVVTITVENRQPEQAVTIANTIAAIFENDIPEIMSVDNVSILSEAELGENPSPVSPNPVLNMAIAFVVGAMAAVGLSFLLEYLDTTIKTEKDIEHVLELPILGAVSNMDNAETIHKQTS
ncbi:YveK family protein [Shouchella shacheensis]|uniref:YveK family protein n=1 Tax=Shouchella shacheensis TaxID=1649580 RepID=UPI0007400877|nr:Wzz/FepE/Etk N-terminal domain-containing protein [Shouchella shacheensis]